jgi:dTDP-4-amino-4,6-dideoxygalactose transaminase
MFNKKAISDLAAFGGEPVFDQVRSTSNLVRPDIEKFLSYSKIFYDQHRYTNDGALVKMLEQRLAAFHGTQFCISFCNGFWALVLTMKCLALPGKTEIVMPSLTYRRMADLAAWVGLTPHYCDVDGTSISMTSQLAAASITSNTALLLGVHPIINTCDVDGLETLSAQTGIPLLFDSVESAFETYRGRKIGGFGRAECFSMHASKLLNGFEAGYVTTNDPELARKLAGMRGFGFYGHDNVELLGMNAKLNEVHAAMALASIDDLPDQVIRNRVRYRAYQQAFANIPGIRLLQFDETEQTSYKNIVVELGPDWSLSRLVTLNLMHAEKILARPYYAPPLHQKKTSYPTIFGPLPITDVLAEKFVLMPCGHFVTEDDISQTADLMRFISANAGEIKTRMQ